MLRTAPAPMFLLSKLVHEQGYKVVLTGEGSDEILGVRYFQRSQDPPVLGKVSRVEIPSDAFEASLSIHEELTIATGRVFASLLPCPEG